MTEINENDLFDNPMIEQARKTMSAEDKNRYKILGEEMFSINFESGLECDEKLNDCKIQIENSIKSGLHISYLSDEEKKFMLDYVGDKWWELYGFQANDLEILYSNF